VLYDDVLKFADKARAAGVPVVVQPFEGLVHWWHLFWRIVPEARQALDQVARFLVDMWAAQTAPPLQLPEVSRRVVPRRQAAGTVAEPIARRYGQA